MPFLIRLISFVAGFVFRTGPFFRSVGLFIAHFFENGGKALGFSLFSFIRKFGLVKTLSLIPVIATLLFFILNKITGGAVENVYNSICKFLFNIFIGLIQNFFPTSSTPKDLFALIPENVMGVLNYIGLTEVVTAYVGSVFGLLFSTVAFCFTVFLIVRIINVKNTLVRKSYFDFKH